MNKLLFILLWGALSLALYFPIVSAFSPKGGVVNCVQEDGVFLANFSVNQEYTTNITASFPVPWDLTLAISAPGGIPKNGEMWVRVTEPESGELCLERLITFEDARPVKAFQNEPSLGLPFTFILDNEEDIKKIDMAKGPFFTSEGQKGVLPNRKYDWEIGIRGDASFSGSLFLTASEKGARSSFLGQYIKILSLAYAVIFSLILCSLLWLWHAGSMYRFVKGALVLLCVLISADAWAGNLAIDVPESELIENCEVVLESVNGGILLKNGSDLIFSKGKQRVILKEGAPVNTLPLSGNCPLSFCFLEPMAKGEVYPINREDCALSSLSGLSLGEDSFMELTRHLGPPMLTSTGSCYFAAWTFTDGSSLFVAHEGDKCYRLERQFKRPGYYLDLRRYGGPTPEWAKWPWRFFHIGALVVALLFAAAIMARAIVFGNGVKKFLKTNAKLKENA